MIIRYSMLDSFIQCPYKFYRTYILGEKEQVKSSALEYGTAIHLALKTYFEGDDPYEIFKMYWDSIKGDNLEYHRFSHDDLATLAIDRYLPNFIRLHAKKFTSITQDETLEMDFEGHTLQGTYDIVGDYEGVLTMCDFKTSTAEYKMAKIIRNPQLYIYSMLYKHKYGKLPSQVMYKVFVKTTGSIQTLKIPLTPEKIESMMLNISRILKVMARMMEENTWYKNYNCFCGTEKECFNG